MTFQVYFSIDINPVGKQRPKFSRAGGFVRTYTPVKTVTYENQVREAGQKAMGSSEPLKTPITAFIHVRLPVPKSYSKQRTKDCLGGFEAPAKKPDLDNVVKSVTDALNGVCYVDDGQIVNIHATKVYATVAGVDVMIKECLP